MKFLLKACLALWLGIAATAAVADTMVISPRAVLGAGGTAQGYANFRNSSVRSPDTLLSASTAQGEIEIMWTSRKGEVKPQTNGMMILAASTERMQPGSYFLQFTGLPAGLASGQVIPVSMQFSNSPPKQVNFVIQ